MSVFHLRINQELLDCTHCRRPLRPDNFNGREYMCRQCVRRQIYCGQCIRHHHCLAADTHSTCDLLNNILAQMKFKCDCNKYIPYCEFLEHQSAKYSTHTAPRMQRECILKTSFLQCSECEVPLWPPIFSLWFRNRLICSACYRVDIGTYSHYTEVEYLLQGITVKCVACKQYLPFSTLGSHQVGDCLKHKLQNIAPGSSAQKKFCDEEETEMGSNSIHGKHKQKAPFEVGNDDASCDDNHGTSEDVFSEDDDSEDDSVDKMDEGEEVIKPKTIKRVAKKTFKTPCDRKAKIAMPYGHKTGSASPSQRHPIMDSWVPGSHLSKRNIFVAGLPTTVCSSPRSHPQHEPATD